jgi:hypothetical protein
LTPLLAMVAINTSWFWIAAMCGIVGLALFIFWRIPKRKEQKTEIAAIQPPKPEPVTMEPIPSRTERSISEEEVTKAREELKILGLEKEIVSYALTRLYEAHAEGKITEAERDRLVGRYKDEMSRIEARIGHNESIITLHDLEKSQSELIKMFRDKFDEINRKIEEVRARLGVPEGVKPAEIPVVEEKPKPKKPVEEKEPPAPKPAPPRTKAEEKIEEIRAEVLKELERLEQMETEG